MEIVGIVLAAAAVAALFYFRSRDKSPPKSPEKPAARPGRDVPVRRAGERSVAIAEDLTGKATMGNSPTPAQPPPAPGTRGSAQPEIERIKLFYLPGGQGSQYTSLKVSARVEVLYSGDYDVEVAEFDFGADPDDASPFRTALIKQQYNFELDDRDEAGFVFYDAEKAAGFAYRPPALEPVHHEVTYFAREIGPDGPGPWSAGAVMQVRYPVIDGADTEEVRPLDGASG